MLNWRLYQMGLVPVFAALAVAAFSLSARSHPLGSVLAPDAFDGARAYADMHALGPGPEGRRPGSAADAKLAAYVEARFRALGARSGAGFKVELRSFEGQTIDGVRTLQTVTAERPGVGSGAPIVVIAHRDAAAAGSEAEMSGTAVLLELARVLADSETRRTIVLVDTSGGSGGFGGAANFARHVEGPVDGAIVLGDLAGTTTRKPVVVPFSDGLGGAPDVLQQTVGAAVTQELGIDPGGLGVPAQIVHLALPLSVGEQGVLNAAGVPAVLLQTDGEVGPSRAQAVSELRLERFGRAALSALYALDGGPELSSGQAPDLYVQHKAIPLWGVRWVVGAMLLAPLLMGVDGLARLRRRGRPQLQTAMWVLSLGAPFWACAIFARVLGLAGTVPALTAPALPRALPLNASAVEALAALALIFAGAWLLHAMASARVASQDAGGRAIWSLLVLDGVAVLVWALNPYQALLVVGALHVWLAAMSVGSSSLVAPTRRAAALGLVALGLVPLGLVLAYYAHAFGMGPGELAWGVSVAVAGGRLSLGGALLWSLAFGSAVGTARAVWALASEPDHEQGTKLAPGEIVTRGPLTYAGPGSLGGTGSALRR